MWSGIWILSGLNRSFFRPPAKVWRKDAKLVRSLCQATATPNTDRRAFNIFFSRHKRSSGEGFASFVKRVTDDFNSLSGTDREQLYEKAEKPMGLEEIMEVRSFRSSVAYLTKVSTWAGEIGEPLAAKRARLYREAESMPTEDKEALAQRYADYQADLTPEVLRFYKVTSSRLRRAADKALPTQKKLLASLGPPAFYKNSFILFVEDFVKSKVEKNLKKPSVDESVVEYRKLSPEKMEEYRRLSKEDCVRYKKEMAEFMRRPDVQLVLKTTEVRPKLTTISLFKEAEKKEKASLKEKMKDDLTWQQKKASLELNIERLMKARTQTASALILHRNKFSLLTRNVMDVVRKYETVEKNLEKEIKAIETAVDDIEKQFSLAKSGVKPLDVELE